MKYDKFFEFAKQAGIEDAELYISKSNNLSFSLFHGEIDNYSANTGFTVIARGLVNGKFGSASCDVWNKEKAKYLADEIAANAKVSENEDPNFIFEGSPKYKRISLFNKELGKISIDEKLKKLYELEEKLKAYDERINEVGGVEYSEVSYETILMNSKGLKLNQKSD